MEGEGRPVVRLEASRGGAGLGVFAFSAPDVFVAGRSPDCHLSVQDDATLSAAHFLLELAPPECFLRDLGSRNGTFLNGAACGMREEGEDAGEAARRARRLPLRDGDVISAGTVEVRVRVEFGSPSPPPGPAAQPRLPVAVPGYRIGRRIGSGGLGTVYLAQREGDGQEVALKIVPVEEGAMRSAQALQREASVALGLCHPNIVEFHGCGRLAGAFYFVMEHCGGGSAAELARERGGALTLREAAPIMRGVLAGLAHAHARGVVHRDIKPRNLLLSGGGSPVAKISDFGLAKNFMFAGLSGITPPDAGAGTLAYMPKEQLLDFRFTKPASDVFSAGATFYALLSGRQVYDFASADDPVQAILGGKVVPLAERGLPLPEALVRVIDRAVSAEPAARFAGAAEMQAALESALGRS